MVVDSTASRVLSNIVFCNGRRRFSARHLGDIPPQGRLHVNVNHRGLAQHLLVGAFVVQLAAAGEAPTLLMTFRKA
jgi:hypothetical protein